MATGASGTTRSMSPAQIRIGDRTRQDLGDLTDLMDSMATVGLLHPVVVDAEGTLVAGARRVAAAVALGWPDVPVTRVNLTDPLRAEQDENTIRLDFRPSEKVAIAEAIYELERAKAKERQRTLNNPPASGNIPEAISKGEARDKAAAAVGWSGRTLLDARKIVRAAQADPSLEPLVEEMDRTGKVHGAEEKLRKAQSRIVRKPFGATNRSTLTVATRLRKVADSLAGYALALPTLDLRDEEVLPLLDEIDMHLLVLRRAVKALKERNRS
jgi:ParB-like chromosome segregation protein Spo0J